MPGLYHIVRYLPKNFVSFICGLLARLTLPGALGRALNGLFVRKFGIDMQEASEPLAAYPNIEAIFTRQLKAGSRLVQGPVVSPADGFLSYSQALEGFTGEAIQAKGLSYAPAELVWGGCATPRQLPKFSWFSTIYLAPHNYHRVHTPVAGQLLGMRYLPGDLWPVNDRFVPLVPRLFCRNERLVFEIAEAGSGGMVYVVMVGALNVGRIASQFWPGFASNSWERQSTGLKPMERRLPFPQQLAAGDELGVFMLGSTVVVIFSDEVAAHYKLRPHAGKDPILMGQSLCE